MHLAWPCNTKLSYDFTEQICKLISTIMNMQASNVNNHVTCGEELKWAELDLQRSHMTVLIKIT